MITDTNTVTAVQQMLTDHPELQTVVQRHAPAFAIGIAWAMRELHLLWNYWPAICDYCESRDGGFIPGAYRWLFGKPVVAKNAITETVIKTVVIAMLALSLTGCAMARSMAPNQWNVTVPTIPTFANYSKPKHKNTMNKLLQLAAYAVIATTFALSAKGQTTNSFPPFDIPTSIQNLYLAIENSPIAQATNWAVAPYVTYSPSTANKVGGGVLAVYNVPQLTGNLGAIGAALGADWLGGWSIVSGNLTIQTDVHPLETVSWLAFLPPTVRNVTMTPIVLAGIGQPMSGGGGAATIWDVGDQIKFGHFLGGRFGVGATWGEWSNAGKQSGHRFHGFLDYQWGF